MEYTAQGEGRVTNIAQGEAECYICYETLTKSCIFHTNEAAVFYVFCCIFTDCKCVNKICFVDTAVVI